MSCYLIKELLPLYIEGDCNADTNQYMAGHLHTCENCNQLYEEMKEPLPFIKPPEDLMPSMDEHEEKRKFEKRYYGKLLARACFMFGIVYVIMIILYWVK
ncbi:hypothetical protein BACPU_34600 [Bacillus pumilus]|nr:hypothetical protein BACPU_34600 [Bacillus pumilus]